MSSDKIKVDQEDRPFWTLKQYQDVAREIDKYTAELGRETASECRTLGWIALGGRGVANREDIAETLEAIARNADALAGQVRELDNPKDIREEEYGE